MIRLYRYLFPVVLTLIVVSATAQRESPVVFLLKERSRIDKLDGKLDGKIQLEDSARTELATQTYITLIDSVKNGIWRLKLSETRSDSLIFALYFALAKVTDRDFNNLERDNRYFGNLWNIVRGMRNNDLLNVLRANTYVSLQQISFYSFRPETKDFLLSALHFYPEEVLRNYHQYHEKDWAFDVVEQTAAFAPSMAKKYIISDHEINDIYAMSRNPTIKTMLAITAQIGKQSLAYPLIDAIVKEGWSITQADELPKQSYLFLKKLIELRIQRHPLAEHSLEKELEIQALKYVREMNDLHNEKDKIRFAGIENFTAAELYTLIVYSEEEIFTSTFNGTFNRMIAKLGKESRYEFLKSLGFNRYRTFIKQTASFGKLEEFLSTMTAEEQKKLMMLFVSGLDDVNVDLGQAVEVADAYSGIKDSTLAAYVRKNIQDEYIRAQLNESKEGLVIYGLLANLFSSEKAFDAKWYSTISNTYKIPEIASIKRNDLFRRNMANVWQLYFYDDEDGLMSFATFMAQFNKDKNWKIATNDSLYVAIEAVEGYPVIIYANKPQAEYEGQEYLEYLLDSLDIQPDVLIHRGHSYYASKTIEKIKPTAKIFVLGSCGGYNSLSTVIQLAPEVHIISSKQIGVQAVNNPLLKLLADNIREGAPVEWENLWAKLDNQLKGSSAYTRFVDYIPPHKNVGAIFIRSYMRLTGAI